MLRLADTDSGHQGPPDFLSPNYRADAGRLLDHRGPSCSIEDRGPYERKELPAGEKAYVFVTNLSFHKDLDAPAQLIAWPVGLGIPDFNRPGHFRLSAWYLQEQKHADALRVADGLSKLLTWPSTFDGSLPSVALRGEQPPIQIGQAYNFEGAGPDGGDHVGVVADALVVESEQNIVVAVNGADGKRYLLKERMTDAQLADYKAHPDAFFGKVVRPRKQGQTPQDLFEFFMYAHAEMPREKLLGHLLGSGLIDGRARR